MDQRPPSPDGNKRRLSDITDDSFTVSRLYIGCSVYPGSVDQLWTIVNYTLQLQEYSICVTER
eukprot:m.166275 g.166275  ORF g.166275 m.166275 type:complete len:63 (+) comp15275_c0_seq4:200-388(+)